MGDLHSFSFEIKINNRNHVKHIGKQIDHLELVHFHIKLNRIKNFQTCNNIFFFKHVNNIY